MTIICPNCQQLRQPSNLPLQRQCPTCGAASTEAGTFDNGVATRRYRRHKRSESGFALGKLLLLVAIGWGVWIGWQNWHQGSGVQKMNALAAKVRAEDVVMYSTSVCPYCVQAKDWLHQNGFAFTECNMTHSSSCEQEFKRLGGDGTPFLVVRHNGKVSYMKDGFDSEQFLALLK